MSNFCPQHNFAFNTDCSQDHNMCLSVDTSLEDYFSASFATSFLQLAKLAKEQNSPHAAAFAKRANDIALEVVQDCGDGTDCLYFTCNKIQYAISVGIKREHKIWLLYNPNTAELGDVIDTLQYLFNTRLNESFPVTELIVS